MIPSEFNSEMDEIRKRNAEAAKFREKMAAEATVRMGVEYESRMGKERVNQAEEAARAYLQAWGKIMGSGLRLNLQTVEAMLAILQNVPPRAGMDLVQRQGLLDLQAELSAVRNKMIRENAARAEAALSTPRTLPPDGDVV